MLIPGLPCRWPFQCGAVSSRCVKMRCAACIPKYAYSSNSKDRCKDRNVWGGHQLAMRQRPSAEAFLTPAVHSGNRHCKETLLQHQRRAETIGFQH